MKIEDMNDYEKKYYDALDKTKLSKEQIDLIMDCLFKDRLHLYDKYLTNFVDALINRGWTVEQIETFEMSPDGGIWYGHQRIYPPKHICKTFIPTFENDLKIKFKKMVEKSPLQQATGKLNESANNLLKSKELLDKSKSEPSFWQKFKNWLK